MLFDLDIKTKTLRIISSVITLIGIVFILASDYIGSLSVRVTMAIILLFSIMNFKMTYKYLTAKNKLNYFITFVCTALGIIKPELIMFLLGVVLLFITVPILYRSVRTKDFSDVFILIISVLGTMLAIYCIVNSRAALNTVIIIIGIVFVILGCLMLFETFGSKNGGSDDDTDKGDFGFEDVE